MVHLARGAVPSPNIWHSPRAYEIENRAVDRAGVLESAIRDLRPTDGATVLDVGCGAGFHLPRFAALGARSVVGVEPHAGLAALARRRTANLPTVEVRHGSAQSLPVADRSVDLSHARWAYFFGPGCEPGLRELARVMRRGGLSVVIDNDATTSTFGRWFARAHPDYEPDAVERFWSRMGWRRRPLTIAWSFDSRSDFEAVVRIEFPPEHADRILAEHDGLEVDYGVNLWWRQW